MILFAHHLHPKFSEFGITVPIRDDRAERVQAYIQSEFSHAPFVPMRDLMALPHEDLSLAHDYDFVEMLGSEEGLEKAIADCYELGPSEEHAGYWDESKKQRPWSELLQSTLLQAAGTRKACAEAMRTGFCFFLGGGMHHAHSDRGKGFCLINDIVMSIRHWQREGAIKNAFVIDVDAHKGDGTAQITHADDTIHTLSIHMKNGWPLVGERYDKNGVEYPWYIPSEIDIEVGIGEEDKYNSLLREGIEELLIRHERPDLVIVVDGADVFAGDALPSARLIKLTKRQCLERDKLIHHTFSTLGVPQAYTMAGGYGPEAWTIYAQFLHYLLKSNAL